MSATDIYRRFFFIFTLFLIYSERQQCNKIQQNTKPSGADGGGMEARGFSLIWPNVRQVYAAILGLGS